MYFGPPFYGSALNFQFVYLTIPGTHPLSMIKRDVFVLFICKSMIKQNVFVSFICKAIIKQNVFVLFICKSMIKQNVFVLFICNRKKRMSYLFK